jgi:RNA recognition motif-containing protein
MARTKLKESSKAKEAEASSPESTPSTSNSREASPDSPSRKRKRDAAPTDELEIDVSLPEPPSRRERRKAKKAKLRTETSAGTDAAPPRTTDDTPTAPAARSPYGIWIGNLPWTATKPALRAFLTAQTGLADDQLTRVHMPAPRDAASAQHKRVRPLNKGFAYVDFATEQARRDALLVSEALLDGRRVLIKASNNFEGRPETHGAVSRTQSTLETGGEGAKAGEDEKPPSKRVFVGNLGYEVTKEDLEEFYQKCGEIEILHMATFEDSGKCKGYAWVTFAELDAARDAVKGWTMIPADDESDDEEELEAKDDAQEEKPKKKKKMRKWFVNRLHGRTLRCEFAEDANTRYKKRFGNKDASGKAQNGDGEANGSGEVEEHDASAQQASDQRPRRRDGARKPREKVDARSIRPGAAHTNAKRASQAIVAGTGTKTTFD